MPHTFTVDADFTYADLDTGKLLMIGAHDPAAAPWDIEVTTNDGRWLGTVATIADLQRLMERWAVSGECLGGRYLWLADLIVVESLDWELIADVVEDLVRTGEYASAMTRAQDDDA